MAVGLNDSPAPAVDQVGHRGHGDEVAGALEDVEHPAGVEGPVRCLLEAAVPDHLGMQAYLDALKHVFEKLPIEQWADCADGSSGVDRDGRAGGGRSWFLAEEGQG